MARERFCAPRRGYQFTRRSASVDAVRRSRTSEAARIRLNQALGELWATRPLKEELLESARRSTHRSRLETRAIDPLGNVPLHSHATYSLYEIIAAYGLVSNDILRETREGVVWAPHYLSDLFLVTLNKSDNITPRRSTRITRFLHPYFTGNLSLGQRLNCPPDSATSTTCPVDPR